MKRTGIAALVLMTVWQGYAGLLGKPVSMRIGPKTGITICSYDDDIKDSADAFGGAGMHAGFGMGADFFGLAAIDLEPYFWTNSFTRDEPLYRHSYSYSNIMFPILISLRGSMVPVVTPYIGVGIGLNLRLAGEEKKEYPNGQGITTDISSSTLGLILLRFGGEIKLTRKLRITPEFTLAATGSGDEDNPPQAQESNYHISVGLYYSP
jgi:hypothetical protein